jgi:hypothetical protein
MNRMVMIGAMAAIQPIVAEAQVTPERPALLAKLVACRAIAAVPERVACYDQHVAALDKAERGRDVALVERTEVNRARRSLFGFPVPRLKIFEGGSDEPEFTRIEATIKEARQSAGRWSFQLDDGSRWAQSETDELARAPKPGDTIRVRRGAVGSFLANIGKAPAIRVRRVE